MANENIGTISCNLHNEPVSAFVRMDKKNKYYIYCPECGLVAPKAAKFQNYITENAKMYGTAESEYKGGGEPEASNEPERPEEMPESMPPEHRPLPQKKQQQAHTEKPKKTGQPQKVGGFLSGIMNALGSEE